MLETLNCNSCGAPIEVPSSTRFVKCSHCNANLKIHRSGGGTFSEAIEQLNESTENLAQQVEKLTQQNELASLDRKWELERQSFLLQSKDGQQHLPSENMAWVAAIPVVIFGGIWTVFAFSITQRAPNVGPFAVAKVVFPLFGLVFIGFGVFAAMRAHQKVKDYRRAERDYRRQRDALMRED